MTVNTYDAGGTFDLPSKGVLALLAFALLCALPLFNEPFVSMVAQASGVTGFLAYVFAWSAAYAMGVIAAAVVGIPALVGWHLLTGEEPRRSY